MSSPGLSSGGRHRNFQAGAGVGQVASRGRKGPTVPATGCAVRPPRQPPGTSLGQAKFAGELLPRELIELPLREWGCSPPTSHWGVLGKVPEWVVLSLSCFPVRNQAAVEASCARFPRRTQREGGRRGGGVNWAGGSWGRASWGGPAPPPFTLRPRDQVPGGGGGAQWRSQRSGGRAGAFPESLAPSLPTPAAPLSS